MPFNGGRQDNGLLEKVVPNSTGGCTGIIYPINPPVKRSPEQLLICVEHPQQMLTITALR